MARQVDNNLITKRRRKKKIKKLLIFFLFLISVLLILSIKLPYLNIKKINVTGNKIVDKDSIIKASSLSVGKNILYENYSKAKNEILKNPYVKSVEINKKLPNIVTINIEEREASFYIQKDKNFYIIDNEGLVLEERTDIKGLNLINLSGISLNEYKISGKLYDKDSRKIKVILEIAKIQSVSPLKITMLDFTNMYNIKCYFSNIEVQIGIPYEITSKLNKAVNIITLNKLNDKKGYIDLSSNGYPVFSIEK